MGIRRRKLARLIIVLACLGAVVWTVASLGPRRVLAVALDADPWWLTLSVLPVLARFLAWGVKWWRLLALKERVPFGTALRILVAGSFVNMTTPTAKLAGGVLRALLLDRHRGWGKTVAYGWAMADQVTNVLGNVLLFGILSVGIGLAVPIEGRVAFLLAGLAVLIGLAVAVALRPWAWSLLEHPAIEQRLTRLVPARFRSGSGDAPARTLRAALDPLLRSAGSAWAMWGHLGLAALAFACLCVANAMVLRAIGAEVPLLLLSIAVVIGYFAGVLIGMGGIGVTEAALTAMYVRFGVPADQAAAGALLHRAMFYVIALGWGGAALWKEGRVETGGESRGSAAAESES